MKDGKSRRGERDLEKEKKAHTQNNKQKKTTRKSNEPVALFTIAKMWKLAQCPSIDEWIQKRQSTCVGE